MLIQAVEVTKTYGAQQALGPFSLQIGAGEIVGLLGLNGSGKTTFMKLVSGLLEPTSGEVTVKGSNPRTRQQQVAYLGDRQGFPHWMNPEQVAALMAALFQDFARESFAELQQVLEIPMRPVSRMSKGQQQKLRLAATMARQVDLYLLDEPLSGIDVLARQDIIGALVKQWQPTKAILITTHEIQDIEPVLNRAVFVAAGRKVGDHLVADLRRSEQTVKERFIADMQQGRGF